MIKELECTKQIIHNAIAYHLLTCSQPAASGKLSP